MDDPSGEADEPDGERYGSVAGSVADAAIRAQSQSSFVVPLVNRFVAATKAAQAAWQEAVKQAEAEQQRVINENSAEYKAAALKAKQNADWLAQGYKWTPDMLVELAKKHWDGYEQMEKDIRILSVTRGKDDISKWRQDRIDRILADRQNDLIIRAKDLTEIGQEGMSFPPYPVIHIERTLSLPSAMEVFIFELHNLTKLKEWAQLDRRAETGQLSEKKYVREIAELEHANEVAAAPIIRKVVKAIDPEYNPLVDSKRRGLEHFPTWFSNAGQDYKNYYIARYRQLRGAVQDRRSGF